MAKENSPAQPAPAGLLQRVEVLAGVVILALSLSGLLVAGYTAIKPSLHICCPAMTPLGETMTAIVTVRDARRSTPEYESLWVDLTPAGQSAWSRLPSPDLLLGGATQLQIPTANLREGPYILRLITKCCGKVEYPFRVGQKRAGS